MRASALVALDVATDVAGATAIDDLLERAVTGALSVCNADFAGVVLAGDVATRGRTMRPGVAAAALRRLSSSTLVASSMTSGDTVRLARGEDAHADALLDATGQTGLVAAPIGSTGVLVVCGAATELMVDAVGAMASLLAASVDRVTESKRLTRLALYDATTGLPHWAAYQRRLGAAMTAASASQQQLTLLLVDLRRVSEIADSFGRTPTRELLRKLAAALRDVAGPDALLGRTGSQQLAAAVPGDGLVMADRLATALEQPVRLGSRVVNVPVQIGLARAPEHGRTAVLLMDHAETALREARTAGDRRRIVVYRPQLTASTHDRLVTEANLRQALAGDELRVRYQPQVDIASGRIVGAEALVRWERPAEGLMTPDRFIPVAEATGLIAAIDLFVLGEACRELRTWLDDGFDLEVAVNLSAATLDEPGVGDTVLRTITAAGVPTHRVELEVTETMAADDGQWRTTLEALREAGVRVAMDDFGTGQSSLGRLDRLPLDRLKIDRSFVAGIGDEGSTLVTAIVAMAHGLGLEIVAEGVETEEQLAFLAERGCERYQGYLCRPPLPPDELLAVASSRNSSSTATA